MLKLKALIIGVILVFGTSCNFFRDAVISTKYHNSAPYAAYEAAYQILAFGVAVVDMPVIAFSDAGMKITFERKEIPIKYSGSAVAVGFNTKSNTLYSLTAGHICDPSDGYFIVSFKLEEMVAEGTVGASLATKVVKKANDADLCLISSQWTLGKPRPYTAKLAKNFQLRGTPIYMIGAPKGIFPIRTDGYLEKWLGIDPDFGSSYLLSILISGGNSGSGVWNYDHEVVGIAVGGYKPNMALAVDSVYASKFLEKAFKELKIKD